MVSPSPNYGHGVPAHQQGNGIAVAGLVLGLLGLLMCWMAVIGWILAIMGIIFGAVGLGKAKKVGKGKGMAITGLVCGSLGLVAGIIIQVLVISMFTSYMKKGKTSSAQLGLRRLEHSIKSYYMERAQLPPSTQSVMPGPDGSGCMSNGKIPVQPSSVWNADPGWRALDFKIDEPSAFSFHWTKTSEKAGVALAVGDLDCDTSFSTYRLDINVIEGNIRADYADPTPD